MPKRQNETDAERKRRTKRIGREINDFLEKRWPQLMFGRGSDGRSKGEHPLWSACSRPQLKVLDEWIARQDQKLSRPEASRRLFAKGLENENGRSRR